MTDDNEHMDDPRHGEGMRAERTQKVVPKHREPTPWNLQVFAKDLMLGRKMAAAALGLDIKTVRNHSMVVRAYYGATSNTQCAYVLGWLKVPKAYL